MRRNYKSHPHVSFHIFAVSAYSLMKIEAFFKPYRQCKRGTLANRALPHMLCYNRRSKKIVDYYSQYD